MMALAATYLMYLLKYDKKTAIQGDKISANVLLFHEDESLVENKEVKIRESC